MPESQAATHTIKSHGAKVARIHLHDWLILLLLIVIFVILDRIEPFHRFVGEWMLTDLRYPMKDNTVPFWAVPIIAILLPLAVVLVYYIMRKDIYDFHHAILIFYASKAFSVHLISASLCHNSNFLKILHCQMHFLGLLYSVIITAVITDAIKNDVGRPRPDFFWRCFPDGKGVFDPITRDVMCTGDKNVIKEGYKSFPSGHASGSFAGLTFLAWYLSGKIKVFDRRGHVAKLCIVFLPILMAAMVAVSRVDDYWHHWQDVFAGGLIGTIIASFCYLQFFPPPYDADGWGPYAYFHMLAESENGAQVSSTTNDDIIGPSQPGEMLIVSIPKN